MAVPASYFSIQSRIPQIMDAVRKAGVPPKFTLPFLESLGFKSSNDRAIISYLKGIGFLDEGAAPTEAYKAYKDGNKSKIVLAQSLKTSYQDIFLANENANELPTEKLKGIFASVTGKGDSVCEKMAATFKAFCNLADFNSSELIDVKEEVIKKTIEENIPQGEKLTAEVLAKSPDFHYNIQIHLPVTKDITVYNAIFKSIKEHLL